ncbi:MAG: 30S ribosomal protein S4 [Candidatus Latescibacteria bacterium]|jgi:small subunit ribosomal protein S4|nr:30S ribosomal protein S4 [Candidatus Latescibacterota bacterium]
MSRYKDANCRICRREGMKLFLKGDRCFSEKCAVDRRGVPPGQHGATGRRKPTEYGIRLREKQKTRKTYGVGEKQFRNYFEKAARTQGETGKGLLQALETRLDNIVYRLGLAPSRKAARQLVLHRHILVNNKMVNIPSYVARVGDVIQVKEGSRQLDCIHSSLSAASQRPAVPWLDLDKTTLTGNLLEMPDRENIPTPVQEQLIIELYSK